MGLRVDMVLLLLMMTYISHGALLKKSSAADFLRPLREKRSAECSDASCSSEDSSVQREMDEVPEVNLDYDGENKMQFPVAFVSEVNSTPDSEAAVDGGSGM